MARVIFGDDATLQYAVTQTTDTLLMIPMTYAAVTGILSYRRMVFANRVCCSSSSTRCS